MTYITPTKKHIAMAPIVNIKPKVLSPEMETIIAPIYSANTIRKHKNSI